VNGDCDLRDFVILISDSRSFKRGHTHYEFTNKVENILGGKEVLLQDKKNTEKWFRLVPPEKVAAGRLKLYGEGIARSSFSDQYRVFIQSFGSGARHLPSGTSILYNHSVDQVLSMLFIYIELLLYYDCDRWSLIFFHWCLFAPSILLTKSSTQKVDFQLNNFVHKIV
jgi:hypothetical protein